ncbi:MAG: hypothetical protein ACREPM_04330 [Gemmatimonadaceae bacterium]
MPRSRAAPARRANCADVTPAWSALAAATSSALAAALPSEQLYLIRVDPPVASSLGPATIDLNRAYADPIKLLVVLHGR